MIADDKENFASRWSRRKIEARKTAEKPAEPQPPAEPTPAARRLRTPAQPRADGRVRAARAAALESSKASLPNTPNS